MGKARVIVSSNLQEYFRTEVGSAASTLGIDLDESLEFYLVNLLCDFSRSKQGQSPGDEPLAFIYKRAVEASPSEKPNHFKELGDHSLYIAGFFTEFIERSLVDIDYYISMGGGAYASLSRLVGAQPSGDSFAELYDDMAQRFTELVDLLNEMRVKSPDLDSDSELLRLYDRWMRTKSTRLHRELSSRGLLPVDVGGVDVLQ